MEKELLEKYCKDGLSQSQIAKELNTSKGTIANKLIKYGLSTNRKGSTPKKVYSLDLIKSINNDYHVNKLSWREVLKKYNISNGKLCRLIEVGKIPKLSNDELKERRLKASVYRIEKPLSEETKRKISNSRKEYLKNNPDKHVWKRNSKFKSIPCEKLKDYLKSKNILFIEEYTALESNSFSVDIAFPDKKIAIEINGNQHYNNDGTLKSYYQERHNLLESNGWTVYELHYSVCFDLSKFDSLIPSILNSETKVVFDYGTYRPKEKKIKIKLGRNTEKVKEAKLKMRKVERPSKEILEKEINDGISYLQLGKKYGVSDNAIKKWAKSYNIILPIRNLINKTKPFLNRK